MSIGMIQSTILITKSKEDKTMRSLIILLLLTTNAYAGLGIEGGLGILSSSNPMFQDGNTCNFPSYFARIYATSRSKRRVFSELGLKAAWQFHEKQLHYLNAGLDIMGYYTLNRRLPNFFVGLGLALGGSHFAVDKFTAFSFGMPIVIGLELPLNRHKDLSFVIKVRGEVNGHAGGMDPINLHYNCPRCNQGHVRATFESFASVGFIFY